MARSKDFELGAPGGSPGGSSTPGSAPGMVDKMRLALALNPAITAMPLPLLSLSLLTRCGWRSVLKTRFDSGLTRPLKHGWRGR
jgi:hypothetical protein